MTLLHRVLKLKERRHPSHHYGKEKYNDTREGGRERESVKKNQRLKTFSNKIVIMFLFENRKKTRGTNTLRKTYIIKGNYREHTEDKSNLNQMTNQKSKKFTW